METFGASAGWWFGAVCFAMFVLAFVAAAECHGNGREKDRRIGYLKDKVTRYENAYAALLVQNHQLSRMNKTCLAQIDALNEELQAGRVGGDETIPS